VSVAGKGTAGAAHPWMRAASEGERWGDAVSHLCAADPVLAEIVGRVGPCRLEPRRGRSHFGTLLRSIVFQQLSGKAAETIHRRFLALFAGPPRPRDVLAASDERLRGAGLSSGKVRSVRALARACEEGALRLPVPAGWDDARVLAALTGVHGIGPWTAQMFLMFHLARPDVWPTGDLGLRKALHRAYRLPVTAPVPRLERLAERWRPWRTVATWYLWRSLDVPGGAPVTRPRTRGSARAPRAPAPRRGPRR
jgi:3-methyladenine DNA glycosylase/8-oxoguanine DNA glycosylase